MKKGFTLIELLAVILLLGVIAVIAIPIVSNVLDESKKGSLEVTIESIDKAVTTACQKQITKEQEIVELYTIEDGVITPKIDIKGDLPKNGKVEVDLNCKIKIIAHDGKNCIKKEGNDVTLDEKSLNICLP